MSTQSRRSFTVEEIARRHGVSPSSVYRWLDKGLLGSVKIGGLRRILAEQEDEFIRNVASQGGQGVREEAA